MKIKLRQRNGAVIMQWIKLTDRIPNQDEHGRVLIYTDGYDFNGEQVFDVKAEALNECFYADPDDQPEVCRAASHWMPHPSSTGIASLTNEQKAADALDAARYRWLRERWGRIEETYEDDRMVFIGDGDAGDGWDTAPDSIDAAIDAAIARETVDAP